MKLRHLFLAAIVALGMMACNNEDVPAVVDGADGTVSVKVVPVSNGAGTRLSGDLSGNGIAPAGLTAESAVKKTQVWVFMGTVLDGYGEAAGVEVKDIPVHVGSRDIIVVVNGGALGLQKLTSKADILAKTSSVPVDITTNGLVMTAETITNVTLQAGKNSIGYAAATGVNAITTDPVKVARVNARVAIVSAKLNLAGNQNQLDIFDNLKEVQVAMFNVNEKAMIFNPNTASGNWLYGQAWPQTAATYESGTNSALTSDFLQTVTMGTTDLIEIANAPYFYVNPLQTADKMLIVLRGKAYKGATPVIATGLYTDADGYTYFPVWINAAKTNYTYVPATGYTPDGKVARNTQYNISLTIKKIGNPTIDPVEEAFLDVKVEVLPWAVVTQEVEWK